MYSPHRVAKAIMLNVVRATSVKVWIDYASKNETLDGHHVSKLLLMTGQSPKLNFSGQKALRKIVWGSVMRLKRCD